MHDTSRHAAESLHDTPKIQKLASGLTQSNTMIGLCRGIIDPLIAEKSDHGI